VRRCCAPESRDPRSVRPRTLRAHSRSFAALRMTIPI